VRLYYDKSVGGECVRTNEKRRAAVVLCVGIAVAILVVLLHRVLTAVPCPFRAVTGLLCPGCGNTGAALALLRGDIVTAFRYNALCFLEFAYIAWVLLSAVISFVRNGRFQYRTPCVAVDVVVLLVILLWGIARNFL